MTVTDFMAKYGVQATARKLVDKRVKMFVGVSLDDLPETAELVDTIDEIANALSQGELEKVKEILSEITYEWIEEACW